MKTFVVRLNYELYKESKVKGPVPTSRLQPVKKGVNVFLDMLGNGFMLVYTEIQGQHVTHEECYYFSVHSCVACFSLEGAGEVASSNFTGYNQGHSEKPGQSLCVQCNRSIF